MYKKEKNQNYIHISILLMYVFLQPRRNYNLLTYY